MPLTSEDCFRCFRLFYLLFLLISSKIEKQFIVKQEYPDLSSNYILYLNYNASVRQTSQID